MKFVTIDEKCVECGHVYRYRVPVAIQPNIFASPVYQAISPEHCRWCQLKARYANTDALHVEDGELFVKQLESGERTL